MLISSKYDKMWWYPTLFQLQNFPTKEMDDRRPRAKLGLDFIIGSRTLLNLQNFPTEGKDYHRPHAKLGLAFIIGSGTLLNLQSFPTEGEDDRCPYAKLGLDFNLMSQQAHHLTAEEQTNTGRALFNSAVLTSITPIENFR